MLTTLTLAAIAAYLVAARLAPKNPALSTLSALAIGLHGFCIYTTMTGEAHIHVSVGLALSLMSLQTAILFWLGSRYAPLDPLRSAVYTIAAAMMLVALLMPASGGTVMIEDWRIRLHVVLSLLSVGLLTLGALQAALLAVQERYLHTHLRGTSSTRLPPIQTMELLLFVFVGGGFVLLSMTLMTGVVFVEDMFAQHLAHKTVLSTLAWAILGTLLIGRMRYGWRGRKAIRWTIAGYGLLLLAYFGSKFILETVLGRQWS